MLTGGAETGQARCLRERGKFPECAEDCYRARWLIARRPEEPPDQADHRAFLLPIFNTVQYCYWHTTCPAHIEQIVDSKGRSATAHLASFGEIGMVLAL